MCERPLSDSVPLLCGVFFSGAAQTKSAKSQRVGASGKQAREKAVAAKHPAKK